MKIINSTKKTLLADRAEVADTFLSRTIGLLGRDNLSEGQALMIMRCRSVHMLFMRFPIDVVFVSRQNRVVGLVKGIRPFRLSPVFWKASFAVEGSEGMIARSSTEIGDILRIE